RFRQREDERDGRARLEDDRPVGRSVFGADGDLVFRRSEIGNRQRRDAAWLAVDADARAGRIRRNRDPAARRYDVLRRELEILPELAAGGQREGNDALLRPSAE